MLATAKPHPTFAPSPVGEGWGEGSRSLPRLLFLRAIPLRDLLLRRVRLGGGLDHRPEDLHVGLVPVRRVAPVLAVPGVDPAPADAFVVAARRLQRLDHVAESERLDLAG